MTPTPKITPELLEYLEKLYPDQAPKLDVDDRKLWATVGQVELVRHLRSLHEEQSMTILEDA